MVRRREDECLRDAPGLRRDAREERDPDRGPRDRDEPEALRRKRPLSAWSEAGIALESRDGGAQNVWRVRVDDESGEPIGDAAPLHTAASSYSPSSTPDGRRLVCVFRTDSWQIDRWVFDPVRGRLEAKPRRIRADPRQMRLKGVSPGGEWLAMLLRDADGERDSLLVRALTGEARRLTNDGLREDFFVWA